MPYTHLTFGQAKATLAARLADAGMVFYTDGGLYPELSGYVTEALRTWNALTGEWKTRLAIPTAAAVPFYDLSVVAAAACGHTLTDRILIAAIQHHLIEPATPTIWTGSAQFTLADVTGALERRRNQFLLETGLVLTRILAPDAPATIGRVALPDSTIQIRRAAWVDIGTGLCYALSRSDEWAFTGFAPSWAQAPDVPAAYSVAALAPLTVQLAPLPLNVGQVDLLVVRAGVTLDPTIGVSLGLPDDWCWVVKWGALADLLGRDGPGRDVPRAQYSEQRWVQGVQLAQQRATRVLQARVDDHPVWIEPVETADRFNVGWQNARGAPTAVMTAGCNLLGVAVSPDAGPYSLTLDVVRNAPVPVNPGDFVQVSRETLDAILDYAQHLALFKCGGAEFTATTEHLSRFMRLAGVTDLQRTAEVPDRVGIDDRTTYADQTPPRLQEASA